MKKVGLKAIAAAMALLMTASLSAPAAAEAADKLLVTSAGGNVLVITQDMVDSEGEFVLSGENFDKVVLPNDVEVKRLYIDNCEIGELNVVSGNNPTVQLWEAKISNVTVSAAELVDENAALKEYIELMDGNTKDGDITKFFQDVQAKNKTLASLAPTIALKGGADSAQEIGAITVSGNAKVNFKDGKNPAAFNIAYASAKEDMEVVVENYKGDINVDQTTAAGAAYGYLDVKTKNSEVANINVKAAGNANVALRSTGSKTANVNFVSSGKALLTLASPVENLKVEGNSSNGTVKVLTSLISADVQGKGMTLNLGPAATVEKATVAGSDNKVNGTGDLLDCTIPEGSTASVEVMGAFVVGNNTYQPLVTEPYEFPTPEDNTPPSDINISVNFDDGTKGMLTQCGSPTLTVANGVLLVTNRNNGYDGPALDLTSYNPAGKTIRLSFKAKNDSAEAIRIAATLNSAGSATQYQTVAENTNAPAGEWVTISGELTVPEDGTAFSLYIEGNAGCSFSLDDISLVIPGGGNNTGNTDNLPDTVEVDLSGFSVFYGGVTVSADGNMKVAEFDGTGYAGAGLVLGTPVSASDYPYVKAYGDFGSNWAFGFKVMYVGEVVENGNCTVLKYGYNGEVMDLSAIAGESVEKFEFSTNAVDTLKIEKIVFAKSADLLP